ncbi:MAG: phospholipid carrier-dependent glycosyltransferase [Candidatus Omnitrophica bacterium]|nr:phospholipid carrier-dependent glycosyltransferase [Candidatus Omnitrophota bacterium]
MDKNIFCIGFLCFFLVTNFFIIGKYSSYPWWHSNGCDSDGLFAATTIGLLNGSSLSFLMHPAASLCSLYGIGYHILAIFSPQYNQLFHLNQITSFFDALRILDLAVCASRIFNLLFSLVFVAIFFSFLYRLTRSRIIATLVTFCLINMRGFLYYSYWSRPDLLALLFIFASLYLYYSRTPQTSCSWTSTIKLFMLIGLLNGLAIFAKIQIIPAVVILFGSFAIYHVFFVSTNETSQYLSKRLKTSLVISLLNMALMPWWMLKRPAFITPDYLKYKAGLFNTLVYGRAQDNFYFPIFIILFGMLVVSLVFLVFAQKKSTVGIFAQRLSYQIFFSNCFVTGLIISIYIILLPISGNLAKYLANTHHLIYSMLTNISYGGYANTKAFILSDVWKKIVILYNGSFNTLIRTNIFYVMLGLMTLSLLRLITKKGSVLTKHYLVVLALLATGIIMDTVSGFRGDVPYIRIYYMIYSLTFYCAGAALFLSLELKQPPSSSWINKFLKFFCYWIMFCLVAHLFSATVSFFKQPRASGITDESPILSYSNTREGINNFWPIVEDRLRQVQGQGELKIYPSKAKIEINDSRKENSRQLLNEGLEYLKKGHEDIRNISKAIQNFTNAIKENPTDINTYLVLVNTYMALGSYQEAIGFLQLALIEFPEEGTLYNLISACYEKVGDSGLATYYLKEKLRVAKKISLKIK